MKSSLHPLICKLRFLLFILTVWMAPTASALNLAQQPLFIASTEPRVMLLLSRDHELSRKAYTDYTDLNNDGTLDTTYNNSVDYYGYFDSAKCYSHNGSYFQPTGNASGHQCNSYDAATSAWVGNGWSGNFLNWATMTRLDVVRKVLYGGFRSTDSTGTSLGTTILERAFLPPDVHAFAKVFAPSAGSADVRKYTPYEKSAITLCNVSAMGAGVQSGGISTVNNANTSPAPMIKVADGAWSSWAMTEILQCQWAEDFAAETSPTRPTKATHRLTGTDDLIARVAVCAPGMLEDKCKSYYTRASPPVQTIKPIGLLQQYSDVDADRRVRFGLMTGSYKKNTSGGVLRKNIKLLSNNSNNAMNSSDICGTDHNDDEIDVCTGQFINQGLSTGIVNSLNRIHIAGYKSMASGVITATNVCGGGGYNNSSPFACSSGSGAGGLLAPTNGTCVDWGNPLSEMYHEAMRYFAGKTVASTDYAVDDSAATAVIANLGQATWDATSDPLPSTEWCALSSIIVLSTGLTSLDNASITSDIAGLAPATLTDAVGTAEGISGHSYLIGSNGVTSNGICSAKTISNLSSASGICPELPHMKGGFLIAGLANANRSVDLRPGYLTNRTQRWASINANWVARQPLGTYTVGLAENLPSFEVTVGSGKINLVPACRSSGANNCSMTDLVVVQQTAKKGNFLISWEDGTAGGDYDMDVISRIQYCVGPDADGCNDAGVSTSQIKVTVSIEQAATGASPMELGYTVTGTSADGTVYPIKVPGTAACDPTACSDGNGGTAANNDMPNDRYFSLLTPSPSARCNVINTTNWPACPNGGPQLPIGVGTGNDTIGCPSGSDCGCPKTTLYTQSATPAGLLENPLWYAAKYGAPSTSWDVKNNVTGALGADGKPDNYFDVRNPANLYTSLEDVFDAASQPDASASSVATNSTNLQTASRVFQAKFSSADWSGQLLSFKFNAGTTALSGTPDWDAGTQINSQNPSTGRVILTKGSSGSGAAFSYSNLSTAGQGSLNTDYLGYVDNCGAERVAYLRGSQTNEGASGTFSCASPSTSIINKFRPRNTSRLGDVVNSSPWYVGEPKAGFSDVDHPGYTAFRVARKNRLPVVYVGGNDGMLHGFDASLNYSSTSSGATTSHSGNEVLAYVPSAVLPNLSKLTDLRYNKNHLYFVDGSPMVGDAYLPSLTTNKWRTVLVGGLGAGGKGYYALDVTDPGTVDLSGTVTAGSFAESNASTLLLWEFGEADDSDMGYAFNMPPARASTNQAKQIVKMANGKWAVVVGNGYNSAAGKAVLYILFVDEGRDGWTTAGDFVKIVADTGGSNGLSTPVPYDSNFDGLVDTIYAGDLKGRMWKFEVGPNANDAGVTATSDPATWKIALSTAGCTNNCTPLFTATDGGSPAVAQPVIWPPEVTRHPSGGRMVLFGTGKYLESSDNASNGVQTFYGVWDNGAAVSRSNLVQQTVDATVVSTTAGNFRTSSSNSVNYAGTDRGWYLNLPTSGERITGIPKLDTGNIIFNTLIPSVSPCSSGGTGWIMSLNYLNGKMPTIQMFDTNNDSAIGTGDQIVSAYQVGAALGGSTLIPNAIPGSPGVAVSSLTSSALTTTLMELGSGGSGRITWREIIQ